MILLGDAIFHWRSSGANLLVGALITFVLVLAGYLACRSPKGRWTGIIIFGAWIVYTPCVFIGSKIWPEEVSISEEGIRGRHDFSHFSIKAVDIHSIEGSRSGKGGYGLHVFLKSGNHAVGIPVIRDQNKEPYKNALRKLCPAADLDW